MTPTERAVNMINKYGIKTPAQLELEAIANAEKIIVEDAVLQGKLGFIVYEDGYGLIKVNRKVQEPGQARFTIAHELGHYCNDPEFRMKMFSCGLTDLSIFKSSATIENEANEFAAEMLMHRPWFNEFIIKRHVSMDMIKEVAEYFSVSLTAAVLRYAKIGKYPVAVIMSKEGVVKWRFISEYFPYKWLPIGYKLRSESAAYDYFQGNEVQTCEDLVPAHTWFSDDRKCDGSTYLHEQNVVMKNYESVLTLLWEAKF